MANDPVKNFYLQGYSDAKGEARKRMRKVPHNFKLTYVSGWYDAKAGKQPRYEVLEDR